MGTIKKNKNMNRIKIRTATVADLPILLQFEQGIITTERPFDATLKAESINYYDIKALILADDSEVVVAVSEDEIVGSAYAKIKAAEDFLDHKEYVYLGFMFTKPEYRRRGINQMIIDNLNKWTISKGLKEVRLDVYNDNSAALRAYEKAGFQRHMITMRMDVS
jgi:ribosomal protein S18 acetylase RimI-like enzyme